MTFSPFSSEQSLYSTHLCWFYSWFSLAFLWLSRQSFDFMRAPPFHSRRCILLDITLRPTALSETGTNWLSKLFMQCATRPGCALTYPSSISKRKWMNVFLIVYQATQARHFEMNTTVQNMNLLTFLLWFWFSVSPHFQPLSSRCFPYALQVPPPPPPFQL